MELVARWLRRLKCVAGRATAAHYKDLRDGSGARRDGGGRQRCSWRTAEINQSSTATVLTSDAAFGSNTQNGCCDQLRRREDRKNVGSWGGACSQAPPGVEHRDPNTTSLLHLPPRTVHFGALRPSRPCPAKPAGPPHRHYGLWIMDIDAGAYFVSRRKLPAPRIAPLLPRRSTATLLLTRIISFSHLLQNVFGSHTVPLPVVCSCTCFLLQQPDLLRIIWCLMNSNAKRPSCPVTTSMPSMRNQVLLARVCVVVPSRHAGLL